MLILGKINMKSENNTSDNHSLLTAVKLTFIKNM